MHKPVIALLYDFDKTLCTKDMQEFTFIPDVGQTPEAFWSEADKLSKERNMDGILAYMYQMLEMAHAARKPVTRDAFVRLGKDVEYYPGVEEWFDEISRFGESIGAEVRHYVISSGLHEIIEGSSIYPKFTKVFACEFLYDENNAACWPKNVVNYTTKTQFLFRINKGVLDVSDDAELNRYVPEDEREIPFRNMIYIGDGITDVPCMKLVKVNGGYSIGVYHDEKIEKVGFLLTDGRVDFIEPADYQKDSPLMQTVQMIMKKMIVADSLIRRSRQQEEQEKQRVFSDKIKENQYENKKGKEDQE